MFYPPQTSFIPVTVALARFFEGGDIWSNYPYWYLGSTPYRYLTGPVVPAILAGLNKIFSGASFFDLSYLLLIASHPLLAVGWGMLAGSLSNRRKVGILVGAISFILPWHWVSALALSDVSAVLAQALTPWVLLGFRVQGLGAREGLVTSLYTLVPIFAFALLLLTNPVASIPAILGLAIIAIVGQQKIERSLKKMLFIIFFGWFLTLWWYGFGYWLTIFGAPSIGGKSAVSAFVSLLNLLRGFVPVILAVVLVFFGVRPRTVYQKFTLAWLTLFGSLTLFRFLADWDFWMDWTAWTSEVEIGVALLLGHFLARSSNASVLWSDVRRTSDTLALRARLGLTRSKASSPRNESSGGVYPERESKGHVFDWQQRFPKLGLLLLVFILAGWFFAWQNRNFWLPRTSIDDTVEYRIAKWLDDNGVKCPAKGEARQRRQMSIVNCQTVFLSGTTAFWLNSLVDVAQVRGGRDEASLDPTWRQAAWEIREGGITEGTERVLSALKINYLVVHTDESSEFYHDFKNVEKFEEIRSLEKVYDEDGDVIYRVGD